MIYGYARISSPKQNIERQIRNIKKEYQDATLFAEVWTGTTSNRKQWQRLVRLVKPGDIIVFDSVSRMSRNAEEGFSDYEMLFERSVELRFLKEPHINTEVFRQALARQIEMTGTNVDLILEGINRFLLELAREQIKLAFLQSEKEVADLHQRTKEGIETARRNGKTLGRPGNRTYETKKAKEAKQDILKLSKNFNGTLKDMDVIRLLGLGRNTYYKYKRQLMETKTAQLSADIAVKYPGVADAGKEDAEVDT